MTSSPLTIWLNRTYATNYWFLQALRTNPAGREVFLIATHSDPTSPVLQAADLAVAEPNLRGNAYVDWALRFCQEHGVDVFLPGLAVREVAQRAHEFATVGVQVMVAPAASIALLDDKAATYEAAQRLGVLVPPWRTAQSAAELESAVSSLRAELDSDEAVCIKPLHGVGAEGFRLLDDSPMTLANLLAPPAHTTSLDAVVKALTAAEQSGDRVPTFLVMPYLAGPEISVDCLADSFGGLRAAIPRAKEGRKRVFLDNEPRAIEIARKMVEAFQLAYLSNTQLRWWRGEPALLEVNTRPSGGLFASSLTGVNLPWAAVQLAIDGDCPPLAPVLGGSFVTVNTVVGLRNAPDPQTDGSAGQECLGYLRRSSART